MGANVQAGQRQKTVRQHDSGSDEVDLVQVVWRLAVTTATQLCNRVSWGRSLDPDLPQHRRLHI